MKILTDKSLDEAIKLCQENERYRVLIVVPYSEDFIPILDYLSQAEVDTTCCSSHSWAKFPNNSVVNIISIANNVRGRRADLVLCHTDVYNDCADMRYILPAIEVTNINFKLFKDEIGNDLL